MEDIIDQLDWNTISGELNKHGYVLVKQVITEDECDHLAMGYERKELYRKTINMERYRFGLGEYKYFNYPLPEIVEKIRHQVYPYLASVANTWMKVLGINRQFPETHKELIKECHTHEQTK